MLLASTAIAEEYQYKLNFHTQSGDRWLGNENIGNITANGLDLFISKATRHSSIGIMAMQYRDYNNSISDWRMITPEQEFKLAYSLYPTNSCKLWAAMTQTTYLNDLPFSAQGVYSKYTKDNWGLELGYEGDQQGAVHSRFAYAFRYRDFHHGRLLLGISQDYVEKQRASIEESNHSHFGSAMLLEVGERLQLFSGANRNTSVGENTWNIGLSWTANTSKFGLNPAGFLHYREKPESKYFLGLFTLWGMALNEHVCTELHGVFFRGGLKQSRIVGNSNYDKPGVGDQHEMQDFGALSIAFSSLEVQAGADAVLMHNDISAYLTFRDDLGLITRPYLGMTWNEFSDLYYDPMQHSLQDPQQDSWEIKVGGKIPVSSIDVMDHSRELGHLRINVVWNTKTGSRFATSWWF